MNDEIGTYQEHLDKPYLDHGILTYINEAAYGEMRDLIRDVGMDKSTIPFYNQKRLKHYSNMYNHESDRRFKYVMNNMFVPLDMTDHEDNFVGWHEIAGDLPINRQSWLSDLQEEDMPQIDIHPGIEAIAKMPQAWTSEEMEEEMKERYGPKPDEPE